MRIVVCNIVTTKTDNGSEVLRLKKYRSTFTSALLNRDDWCVLELTTSILNDNLRYSLINNFCSQYSIETSTTRDFYIRVTGNQIQRW